MQPHYNIIYKIRLKLFLVQNKQEKRKGKPEKYMHLCTSLKFSKHVFFLNQAVKRSFFFMNDEPSYQNAGYKSQIYRSGA